MAEGGHAAVPFTYRARPEFGKVVDELARRRGLNRSAYIRELVTEDAIRLAEAEQERKRV